MELPNNYLDRFQKKTLKGPVNERQDIIQDITDRINRERKGTPFKPASWQQINGKVAHLKGFELKWFYRECVKAQNFSKSFFGRLKLKDEKTKTEIAKPKPIRQEYKRPEEKKLSIKKVIISVSGTKKEVELGMSRLYIDFKDYEALILPITKNEEGKFSAKAEIKLTKGVSRDLQGKLLLLPLSYEVTMERG